MPTTIVFLNRFYAPDHSATAQLLTDLAEHLASRGISVTVIASRAVYGQEEGLLPRRERRNGVDVIRTTTPARRRGMAGRVAGYLAYFLFASLAAWRISRRDTILVVKTDPPLLSVPIALVAWLRGARLVHWLQDLYPEIAVAYGMRIAGGPVGGLLTALRNASLRRADHVVAIGEIMAERIATMRVERGQISVIANWSDDAGITPRSDRSPALRADWDIATDAFVLAYSGNLGRAHEYETLLAAARALRAREDVCFLFIGGGHMSEQLARRVAAEGLTSFRFAPYQPRERLGESLGAGDAHWISLRPEFEGLIVPSKVFGICAAGRPILSVSANDGELARMLGPASAALIVAPGDGDDLARAIVALADDRARREAMGAAANALLRHGFTKAHALARWDALFEALGVRPHAGDCVDARDH